MPRTSSWRQASYDVLHGPVITMIAATLFVLVARLAWGSPSQAGGQPGGPATAITVVIGATTTTVVPTTTTGASTTSSSVTTTTVGVTTTTVLGTFFSDSYAPTPISSSGTTPANLGIKFTPSQDATITAIQFYKPNGTGNGGTHVGYIWREFDTALMGQVTFTGETSSGWQTATFSPTIPVVSGIAYRATYSATAAFDFSPNWTGATANPGPFTAAPGGVYALATPGTYPASTSTDWYLVDIKWTVP